MPGSVFRVDGGSSSCLRLDVAHPSADFAVVRLGELCAKMGNNGDAAVVSSGECELPS